MKRPDCTWNAPGLAVIVGLAMGTPATAQSFLSRQDRDMLTSDRLSVSAYGGLLTGMAQEFVFDTTGNTISRLDWRSSISVVGGEANIRIVDTLKVHIGGYTSLGSGNGAMDDYDWLYTSSVSATSSNWTHWSTSPNTQTLGARMLEADLRYQLLDWRTSRGERMTFDLLGGLRYTAMNWTANGGTYVYSTGGSFRNSTGALPDTPVISYEQNVYLPYIGLGTDWTNGRYETAAEITGTLFGWGNARDQHYLRTLEITQNFTSMAMISARFMAGYRVLPNVTLFGRLDYQQIFLTKAPGTYRDYGSGVTTTYNYPVNGTLSQTLVLAAGLKGRF